MNGRRRFLAFLGGASVTGLATTRASAMTPTLILPPSIVPAAAMPATNGFAPVQLLASHVTDFLTVAKLTPADEFEGWLQGGLRVARLYNGRSEAEVKRELRARMQTHAEAQSRESSRRRTPALSGS